MRKFEHTLALPTIKIALQSLTKYPETFFTYFNIFALSQVRWNYIIITKDWMYEFFTSCRTT